jgi:hypothetical protein
MGHYSSGKSVLCSSLIISLLETTPSRATAYFFCDVGESTRRSSVSMLRSLIAQLVAGKSDLVRAVLEEIIESGEERTMSFKKLAKLFRAITKHQSTPASVVIDIWDECEDVNSSSLLELLVGLANETFFRAAIFSRPSLGSSKV